MSGFLFGCGTAGVVKLLRLETRWLGSTFVSESQRALDNVLAAREAGQYDSARAELRGILRTEPDSVEAWREDYELALVAGDSGEVTRALNRLP